MPSDPTVEEVRELLEDAEKTIGTTTGIGFESDEGRQLLAALCRAYLADREAVDVEAIKREAVREFAEAMLTDVESAADFERERHREETGELARIEILGAWRGMRCSAYTVRKLAAARSVTLESERGA